MNTGFKISREDSNKLASDLTAKIAEQIHEILKRTGAIVGISGGIDSTVTAALCVRALGADNVLGVILPEKESSPDSRKLAENLAGRLGIKYIVDDITPALEGLGCYDLRNIAIKEVFPEFTPDYKAKIVIASNPLEKSSINFFRLTIESPEGETFSKRLGIRQYLQVTAASNMKQRVRMLRLYYHAERLNYAVVGTGNKDEHELGFFVKYGDGGTDLKPIVHLFKVQIFELARALDLPDEIIDRIPTTDTYSAEVSQSEFFFGVDFPILDGVWHGMENGKSADEIASDLGLTSEQVQRIQNDILQKKRTTEYLRLPPLKIS